VPADAELDAVAVKNDVSDTVAFIPIRLESFNALTALLRLDTLLSNVA
jgi:hypothetical protein